MTTTKTTLKTKTSKKAPVRVFEADALAFQSLRLIAAPRPEDDLSRDEIVAVVRKSSHSTELIQQLIDYIKTI